MSVMVVTSLGEFVIDLFTDRCPLTSKNFLKLCKMKYYNGCLFHTVQKDFTAQTGDPTGTGTSGDSIYKFLYGDQARFFKDEIFPDLKHSKMGTVAMASAGENLNASQFYITLRDDLDYLDEKHTIFGEVAEGHDTLTRINEAYVDEKGRPYRNIRIKHTYVLDDPFEDPPQLTDLIPDASPEGRPKEEVDDDVRLEDDWVPLDEQIDPDELQEVIRTQEAHSRAVVLESLGDIPDADVKPPENVLFVCKLNPVTEDEDLHTIFSRFGTVTSAEIIRDYKTGDSLCYAFIEFEDNDACERAYSKMDNALIDDRRIHVDFSQSVSKLWNQFRRKGTQGRGCFKCGALDHIAKDCTMSGSVAPGQHQKYVLKDDNRQHGGNKDASYEMVFEEDGGSPKRERRQHGYEEGDRKRHRSERSHYDDEKSRNTKSDSRYNVGERRDKQERERSDRARGKEREESHGRDDRARGKEREDGHGRDDRSRGKDREDSRGRDDRSRGKDREDSRGRDDRRRDHRNSERNGEDHRERRSDADYKKKTAEIDRLEKRNGEPDRRRPEDRSREKVFEDKISEKRRDGRDEANRRREERDADVPRSKRDEHKHGRILAEYSRNGNDERRRSDRR